jgi:hypothetical protein
LLTETISRLRNAGGTGQLTVGADSAFYSRAMLTTAGKFNVWFSVTARQDKKVRAAIASIPDLDPGLGVDTDPVLAVHPGGLRRGRRRDQAAETSYTCFASTRDAITVRLVRRVRPTPGTQLAFSDLSSPTGTITPWSPTATVTYWRSRPITAATPWSSSRLPS